MERFGDMFKRLRVGSKQTLRAFCLAHGFDPGNISRLERGRMAAPEDQSVLASYADALGLKPGSVERQAFEDLAAAERGRIPSDLMTDEELVKKLPVLFRSMRDAAPASEEALRDLAEEIRKL